MIRIFVLELFLKAHDANCAEINKNTIKMASKKISQ